jgi:hypothetical protein
MSELLPIEEVTATIVDYGCFTELAARLARDYKTVNLYNPFEDEYLDLKSCVQGSGIKGVNLIEDFMSEAVIKQTDVFIFPDRGYGPRQRYLRSLGKAVYGSMGFCLYEEFRTDFLDLLKETGLPMTGNKVVRGVTALSDHLKTVKDKYVKINRFRKNMETWHHIDYVHSIPQLEYLALTFGGAKELVIFVVQDKIEAVTETGYDGDCVDGIFPSKSFSGPELKNELYLATWSEYEKLPKQLKDVNAALAPKLKEYGYRNWIATEVRITDEGEGLFIDLTPRLPGQTGEHQLETCTNLPERIWKGANGIMVEPEFSHKFAAEATMHYTAGEHNEWKVIDIPEEVRRFVKLAHYAEIDGHYHFPPARNDEVGVVIGQGNTIEKCLDDLKEHFDALKNEPLAIEYEGFAELIDDIKSAAKEGIKFTDQKIPPKEIAIQ